MIFQCRIDSEALQDGHSSQMLVVYLFLVVAACSPASLPAQATQAARPPADSAAGETPAEAQEDEDTVKAQRMELNLLGKVDADGGESRRNENVQFNLIDNNALKELNIRTGVTATIVREFQPDRNYFSAEFGNPASASVHLAPDGRAGWHGDLFYGHLNSMFSARSFFQVGDVKPARENDYGVSVLVPLGRKAARTHILVDGAQSRIRGNVNGNVLVPRADERTPLASDPATAEIVARYLAAYPAEAPNRTDINERLLNSNSPQSINNNTLGARLDHAFSGIHRLSLQYQHTSQRVVAFQLVAGQNPDTDTRSHKARVTWNRNWGGAAELDLTAGFDRIGSLLVAEPNAVGPMVMTGGLTTLGPLGNIPIDRAMNLFRYGGQIQQVRGQHNWSAGFGLLRRQLNGKETDVHRGFFSFGSDFERDPITNLRWGTATQHIISIGDIHRGLRNWDMQYYVGDRWALAPNLQVQASLRYTPVTSPYEVNNRNTIPYDCDCNNFAPQLGIAWRAPGRFGVVRTAYGLHYGEIFPVTYQQIRFSPPGNYKIVVPAPYLPHPLAGSGGERPPDSKPTVYDLDRELSSPYSHQYNFTWEPELMRSLRLQLAYVGSRSHRLLIMWYRNRAHPTPGIDQITSTVNQRRADPDFADLRLVLNGSRGYFDAARITALLPRWRGLSLDLSYWFSKAMDLGSNYTNTANESDSRLSRSQWEFETQADMKGRSAFDQPHGFLLRGSYSLPAGGRTWWRQALGGWEISGASLLKSGTPFAVVAGADGPLFGNVDGNGGDRPHLLDPSVLGRTIGNPDTSRQLLPKAAFRFIEPTEPRGNLGNNVFRKGSIRNVNAALSRSWPVASDKRITLRAETINAFNTPQFAEPGFEMANFNFAAITNTLNDGRTFRFQLRFGW